MISEKIQLLGAGLYTDIPNELTLTAMPTATELEYVSSEDFEVTMLDKILPKCIEEDINFHKLLEIDFQWICRCLRIINYGPYFTANRLYCSHCGEVATGEFIVNLESVKCKPIPEGFTNDIKISRDEFIDYQGDVKLKLLTIQDTINAYKDSMFKRPDGKINRELARICYSIKSMGKEKELNPIQVKLAIDRDFSGADYIILKNYVADLTDFGLRAGGSTQCPKCGNPEAAFIALVDDRFLRPTLGDLKQWRADKRRE